MPPTTVITRTPPTSFSVLTSALKNAGSGQEILVVQESDEGSLLGVEQIVVQQREPQRQAERHDHPEEQHQHRRRDGRFRQCACLACCHGPPPRESALPSASFGWTARRAEPGSPVHADRARLT